MMKRANNLLPQIYDIDNLRLAFWRASKGKRYAKSVLTYQAALEINLRNLQNQILTANVKVGEYRYFMVYEPKEREICASAFDEQVLHHALMNKCHDYFDRKLIYDCYASRKGKGTYAALSRAKDYTKLYDWYLKLDVRKFFASVHHTVLKDQLALLFKEDSLLNILYQIIDSYHASSDRGLPIGNLTSQYFANHNLFGLDHFIKEKLKVKAYVRYMDDMLLWNNDKATLINYLSEIDSYLASELQLSLKPIQLNKTKLGVPFLGYRIFPHDVRLLQKSKQRYIRKINLVMSEWDQERLSDKSAASKVLPLLAFTNHANTWALRKGILAKRKGQTP